MLKMCYLSFYVDFGPSYWPGNINEYLLIGIYLPLLNCLPWTLRRSISVVEVEKNLRSMWKDKTRPQGIVLRQFLALLWRISGM